MTGLSLSGFLPGEERNGLGRLAESLAAGFDRAYETDEEEPRVVVVGVLHPVACKHKRDDDGNPSHAVELRFVSIEVVEGPEADQVKAMVLRLRDSRTNVQTLPYATDVIDSGTGYSTGDLPPLVVEEPVRPKRPRKGGLTAVPDPFTVDPDAPDEYATPDDEPESP